MSDKQACFVCGSVRHRKDLVEVGDGRLAHKYHHGVEECKKEESHVER